MQTSFSLLLILLFVASCSKKSQAPTRALSSSQESTQRVLDHHWKTFMANDLDGTMADYTEESLLITPDKTYRGLAEIRQNFVNAFAAFPKDSSKLQLDKSLAVQDVGYIIWQATTPKFKMPYGTDTFIIQNGKIIRQTFCWCVHSALIHHAH